MRENPIKKKPAKIFFFVFFLFLKEWIFSEPYSYKVYFRYLSSFSFFFLCLLISHIVVVHKANAQNLDQISSQQPFSLNGFISTNQVANNQSALQGTGMSYNDYYTGSLNLNIYGISVPLQFSYSRSNRQGGFTHPFNQIGIHPSWKWIKVHAGYSSMSFSPYSLGGHLFKGGGFEINPPGIFRASAMIGELRKPIAYDSTQLFLPPSYQRIGMGLKIGLAFEQDQVDLSIFHASDREGSLESVPETFQIAPQENIVLALSVRKRLVKNLNLGIEYGNSALTADTRADRVPVNNGFFKPSSWFIIGRTTTINRTALKVNMNYTFAQSSIGVGYEKIDPDYTTLGAYYFTNNFENITLNYSGSFLENKLSLSTNAGLQKDNLDNSRMNNNTRFVGSGNINVVPGEKLNIGLSYSNFLSYTNVKSTFDFINQTEPFENWDTLNYRQVSQNFGVNSTYQLVGDKEKRQILSFNLTYQISDNLQNERSIEKSDFYNLNFSHLISFQAINLNINTHIAMNRIDAGGNISSTWGPGLTISKLFLERTLRTSLTTAYNTSSTNGLKVGDIYNFRLGIGYSLKKQHQFNLNFLYQLRQQPRNGSEKELVHNNSITLAYVYNFSMFQKNGNKE